MHVACHLSGSPSAHTCTVSACGDVGLIADNASVSLILGQDQGDVDGDRTMSVVVVTVTYHQIDFM